MNLDFVVVENVEASQFDAELKDGTHVGEMMFVARPAYLDIYHTGVEEEFEGQGVAGKMAREVLDIIRAKNLKIWPRCPYLANFIQKHPEYEDLVYTD